MKLTVKTWFLCLICALCLVGAHTHARTTKNAEQWESSLDNLLTTSQNDFKPESAWNEFDQMSLKLSTQNLRQDALEKAVVDLTELRTKAQVCADEAKETLKNLETFAATRSSSVASSDLVKYSAYIEKKRNSLKSRVSSCELFLIRSSEAIEAYSQAIQSLATSELFEQNKNLLHKLHEIPKIPLEIFEKFDKQIFFSQLGHQVLQTPFGIASLIFVMALAILLGHILRKKIHSRLIKIEPSTFGKKTYQAILAVTHHYGTKFFILLMLCLYLSWDSLEQTTYSVALYMAFSSLCLLGYFFFVKLLFNAPPPASPIAPIPREVFLPTTKRLRAFGFYVYIGYLAYLVFKGQPISKTTQQLANTLFTSIMAISMISVLWLANQTSIIQHYHKKIKILISIVLTTLVIGIVTSDWLGYSNLANYMFFGIGLSFVATIIFSVLHLLIMSIFNAIFDTQKSWQQNFRMLLGMKKNAPIPELVWLRLVLFSLIWISYFLIISKAWRVSDTGYNRILDTLLSGFTVAEITIIPSQIFIGFVILPIGILLTRFIRNHIVRNSANNLNRGARGAVAALVGYAGFILSFLVAMLIAGVNFSGLAIIAGALSVGIGFGLQNVVNNFVSGLILLIERPIKVGDRVIVGDIEGHVKKISIRYTQLRSDGEFADIILPNSQLISGRLDNLMLTDMEGRITVKVGVAYGSKIDLVKDILIGIAQEHPEVITERSEVWFREFGDSALVFDLRCIVKDIDRKYVITSELNFMVDKAFHEHNVVIAFPQRDLHIKTWEPKPGSVS